MAIYYFAANTVLNGAKAVAVAIVNIRARLIIHSAKLDAGYPEDVALSRSDFGNDFQLHGLSSLGWNSDYCVDPNDRYVAIDASLEKYAVKATVVMLKNVTFRKVPSSPGAKTVAYVMDLAATQRFDIGVPNFVEFPKGKETSDCLEPGSLNVLCTVDGDTMDSKDSFVIQTLWGRTEYTLQTPATCKRLRYDNQVSDEYTLACAPVSKTPPAFATTFPITIRERRPTESIPLHFVVKWLDQKEPMTDGQFDRIAGQDGF